MNNLNSLTRLYVNNFNSRSVEKTAAMFDKDCNLIDPGNIFIGIDNITGELANLLSFDDLELTIQNIFVCEKENTSILEFSIIIDGETLEGVDIIKWKNNKIIALNAYVNQSINRQVYN
jgi:hypothetical protein